MVEFVVLGTLAFAAIVVFAVLASVFGLVVWLVFLPFRIVGWMLQGLAFLLAVPFLVAFGALAFVVFGAGMMMFFVPLIPIALLIWGIWWLVRRSGRSAATVTR